VGLPQLARHHEEGPGDEVALFCATVEKQITGQRVNVNIRYILRLARDILEGKYLENLESNHYHTMAVRIFLRIILFSLFMIINIYISS
jgi:hypothetical protein